MGVEMEYNIVRKNFIMEELMNNCKKTLLKGITLLFALVVMVSVQSVSSADIAKAASDGNAQKTVWFGSYYQTKVTDEDYISRFASVDYQDSVAVVGGVGVASTSKGYYYSTPIEWIVVDSEGDNYTLLSKKVLSHRKFDSGSGWPDSSLRNWCNSWFLEHAFSEQEQANMIKTKLTNDCLCRNPIYTHETITTTDYVWLLDEFDINGGQVPESEKIAYTSEYAGDGNEYADNWYLRGNPYWYYYNSYTGKYVTTEGAIHTQKTVWDGSAGGNYEQGIRPVIKVKKSAVSETEPEVKYDFSLEEYDAEKAAIDAMPDMSNLGVDEIKGPALSLGGSSFNLWSSKVDFSIGIKNFITAKYSAKDQTVDLIIGLGPLTSKEIKTPDPKTNDYEKWTSTYNDIKSMVNACKKDSSLVTWNKFQKTRAKLKEFDSKAVYAAKGSVAGYVKFKVKDGKITSLLESGMVTNLELGASVKTPFFYVAYIEFGLSGKAEGKLYVECSKSYQIKGSVKLAIEPTLAVGADVFVADVKGGFTGNISGNVSFPWVSFKKSVNASLTGSLFISANTIIPGIKGEKMSWDFDTLELYPELGKVTEGDISLGYKGSRPASIKSSKKMARTTENILSKNLTSIVYENAKPQIVKMENGKYLVTYLDEVDVDGDYQVKAMYRIGDGENWSDPVEINKNTVLNTAVKIAKLNNKYYFMYEGSTSKFDDTMENSEIAGSLELYVSVMEDGVITKSDIISQEGNFKYDYDLVVNNDKITAIWAENTENDILLETGATDVFTSEYSEDNNWTEKEKLFSVNNPVQAFSAGVFAGKVSMTYVYAEYLYVNNAKKITGIKGVNFDSAKIVDGKIYYRSNGELYLFDGNTVERTNVHCGVNYAVQGDEVYWKQQMNYKSDIYKQKIGEETAVKITDDDTYIGDFCLVNASSDQNCLVYTSQHVDEKQENPYGATALCFDASLERYKASVTDIGYNILDFDEGKSNDFTFEITNEGTQDLHKLKLIVESDGNKIYTNEVLDELAAGKNKSVTCALENVKVASTLNAYIVAEEDVFALNNVASLLVEKTAGNISISKVDGNAFIVKNESDETVNNIVVEIKNAQYGDTVRTIEIDSIESGEGKQLSLEHLDWISANEMEGVENGYSLYCQVSYNDNEMELWDNAVVFETVDSGLAEEIKKAQDSDKEDEPISSMLPTASPTTPPKAIPTKKPTSSSGSYSGSGYYDSHYSYSSVSKPKKVTGLKVKAKKNGKVRISWTWNVKADGYQIQYAMNKSFTKKKKIVNKGALVDKTQIKKLKKKKTYYFRVRAYKKDGYRKLYGKWSGAKKCKVK